MRSPAAVRFSVLFVASSRARIARSRSDVKLTQVRFWIVFSMTRATVRCWPSPCPTLFETTLFLAISATLVKSLPISRSIRPPKTEANQLRNQPRLVNRKVAPAVNPEASFRGSKNRGQQVNSRARKVAAVERHSGVPK